MPNQLSIPFKKTYPIPIRQVARQYLLRNNSDTHPDAFKWDLGQWEELRKDGVGGVVHCDRLKPAFLYHAQLVYILTKLPPDIGLDIPYAPIFNPGSLPEVLSNLEYERCCVIFNLASLYCQLAAAEDRSNPNGLKQAIQSYQNAAGVFNFLCSAASPKLRASLGGEDMPLELSEALVESLEFLMLAQAQECAWQRAVIDNYKNGVIAKVALKVSELYENSLNRIQEASPSIKHVFPHGWVSHLEAKRYHFEAAAQYRKSVDDLEANRYGHEIARLLLAKHLVDKGYAAAKKNGVAQAVLQDIQSLRESVVKNLGRAERDNDLIYHQEVLPSSGLSPIVPAALVKPMVPTALLEPKTAIGGDAVIFGELLAWGARTAIDIYTDRRQNWINNEVSDLAQGLDDIASESLRALNLPAALEALEKPIGLPPSLLKKAEEVRSEQGPSRIESSIEDVQRLAQRNLSILEEVMDILDQEAEEDEIFRAENSTDRLPSSDANKELVDKAQRFHGILNEAAKSDEVVRRKYDDWGPSISELTQDEASLEESVPSSTVYHTSRVSSHSTQVHARALRVLLESLDDVQRSRHEQVIRAKRLADAEDITPRILKAAAGFEQWVEVKPAMLEDVLEEEMMKYEKFRDEIVRGKQKQEELLASIKERNTLFLQSRKEDPVVKEREHALQSLDLAYHKYKEIIRNLDEGLTFYNQIGDRVGQLREVCKSWANERRAEMHALNRAMESVALGDRSVEVSDSLAPTQGQYYAVPHPDTAQPTDTRSSVQKQPVVEDKRIVLDLPPPDSDEWETPALPPAPLMSAKKPKRTR
ncbi:pH-response regulator [Abortiporus biennis]|nr:pH-response regulator [Abortiporus biennis]